MEEELKIISWNCNSRSCKNYIIPSFVVDKILETEFDADIIILNEALPNFSGDDEIRIKKRYILLVSDNRNGNVIVFLYKKELKLISSCNYLPVKGKTIDFIDVIIEKKRQKFNVIGYRMLVFGGKLKEDYNDRREKFDDFVTGINLNKADCITVLIGDFNNAKHYGELDDLFLDVEQKYWTQNYDKIKRCYIDQRIERAQYNYNLHKIKDILNTKGLMLRDNDYSFIDKNNVKINNDHLFVSENYSAKADFDWSFINSDNGYGCKHKDESLEDCFGLPDHALLKGIIKFSI